MARRSHSVLDIRDWRISMGMGIIIGMLIVGLPQLIGLGILISLLALTLKLVEKERI